MIEVTKLCSKRFPVIFLSLLFYCLHSALVLAVLIMLSSISIKLIPFKCRNLPTKWAIILHSFYAYSHPNEKGLIWQSPAYLWLADAIPLFHSIAVMWPGGTPPYESYVLLTKLGVKMIGYWPSSFQSFYGNETKSKSINYANKARPISTYMDRASLVSNGFIYGQKGNLGNFVLCRLGRRQEIARGH